MYVVFFFFLVVLRRSLQLAMKQMTQNVKVLESIDTTLIQMNKYKCKCKLMHLKDRLLLKVEVD